MPNRLFYIVFSVLLLTTASIAQAAPSAASMPIPKAPSSGAKAFIIQDYNSGRILASGNADQSYDPASITLT